MKNLKKITALVIVFALCLSAVSFAAFTDVKEDAGYAEAVEVMSSLGLLVGYEDGTFGPDKTITRAEFATVIVRAIGMENSAAGVQANTGFDDVKAEDWFSGYVQVAKQQGIIAGYDEKTFGPNDEVTYEQVIKMVVCALGYGPKFLNNPDAYPSAYISQANSDGITNGVNVKGGTAATRADVAKLVYNSLTVKLMEQTSFGGKPEWATVEKTLLSEKLKIAKVEVTVDAIKFNKDDAGKIAITVTKADEYFPEVDSSDSILVADGINVADVKGYSCVAYIDTNEDDEVIKALAAKSGRNKTLVISKEQAKEAAVDVAKNELNYYKTNSDIDSDTTKVKLSDTFVAYENLSTTGENTSAFASTYAGNDFQSIKLIDNDNNGKYDVAFVTVYSSFIVGEINARTYKVTPYANSNNNFNGSLFLDPEDEDETFDIKDKDGKSLKFDDIKVGDVVNVIQSNDGTDDYYEVIISNDSIEGSISEKNEIKSEFKIGDKFREVADGLINTLSTGDTGTFVMDIYGVVLKFIQGGEGVGNFALGYAIYVDNSGVDNDPKMMLYHTDGKFQSYEFATNVRINSKSSIASKDLVVASGTAPAITYVIDPEYAVGGDSSPVNEVIMYEMNKSNQITALYYGDAGIKLRNSNYRVSEETNIDYKAGSKKIGSYYVGDNSIFFSNSEATYSDDKSSYSMFAASAFAEEKPYSLTIIADSNKNIVAGYLIGNAAEADKASKVMFVTGIGSGTDSEGASATIVTGIVADETVKIVVNDDARVYGLDANGSYSRTSITKGSVIQYAGTDEVAAVRLLVDADEIVDVRNNALDYGVDERDKNTGFMTSGQVYEIIGSTISFGANSNSTTDVDVSTTTPTMVVRPAYDSDGDLDGIGKVYTNRMSMDLAETFKTQDGSTNSNDDYVIVYKFDDEAKFVVIVDYDGDTKF